MTWPAEATVSVAGAPPFVAYSPFVHLVRKNTRTVLIRFTPKQLTEIGKALKGHRQVSAMVDGAIVDSGGNVERRSLSLPLTIAS